MEDNKKILENFLELLLNNPNQDCAGGCYNNTLIDIYLLSKRLGVDPKSLSIHKEWVKFCTWYAIA